jgi:hypothetical protein
MARLISLGGNLIYYSSTDWDPPRSAVFRNPGGTPAHQDEYITVDGWSEYSFSIVKVTGIRRTQAHREPWRPRGLALPRLERHNTSSALTANLVPGLGSPEVT